MKKTIFALAATVALGLASAQASAVELLDFTVQEGSVPGAFDNLIVADKLTGNYNEIITFDGLGGFSSVTYWDAGQFVGNDGASILGSQLGAGLFGATNQYQMYAVLTTTGTVGATTGGFTFTGTSASLVWYIDPSSDTTKAFTDTNADTVITAADGVTLGNTADDYLIASSSSLLYGEGHIFTGTGANGDFQIVFNDLVLTIDGEEYFISPDPFYINMEVTGQLNTFDVVGTQAVNGSADVTFVVPEPGILGLMGLGLLGLAASSRRRKTK